MNQLNRIMTIGIPAVLLAASSASAAGIIGAKVSRLNLASVNSRKVLELFDGLKESWWQSRTKGVLHPSIPFHLGVSSSPRRTDLNLLELSDLVLHGMDLPVNIELIRKSWKQIHSNGRELLHSDRVTVRLPGPREIKNQLAALPSSIYWRHVENLSSANYRYYIAINQIKRATGLDADVRLKAQEGSIGIEFRKEAKQLEESLILYHRAAAELAAAAKKYMGDSKKAGTAGPATLAVGAISGVKLVAPINVPEPAKRAVDQGD